MYRHRTLENLLPKTSRNFKAILLTGMRQVGKTTLLQQADEKRRYVSFDNPKTLLTAQTEPELFFADNPPPLLIDEAQYAPELFRYIKMAVDKNQNNGGYWLTGSQQFSLMKGVSESLADRIAIVNLLGFSLYERENFGLKQKPFLPKRRPASVLPRKNPAQTAKVIWQGAYPQSVAATAPMRDLFYSSYLKTYLERDVRQIGNVSNESAFLQFLSVVAARTAQELNLTEIAGKVGIAVNTAKQWLSILETSNIVYLLRPYHRNPTKRLIKRPKIYFTDTGLCAYLTENTPETIAKGTMSGAFFETFVVIEILKSYQHNGIFPTLYYYRDSDGNEIDLLIHRDETYYPIEIKKSVSPQLSDAKHFPKFAQMEKIGYGNVICQTDQPYPLSKEVGAISIWDI